MEMVMEMAMEMDTAAGTVVTMETATETAEEGAVVVQAGNTLRIFHLYMRKNPPAGGFFLSSLLFRCNKNY